MIMSAACSSCWMFYIFSILLAYLHSVNAGCQQYHKDKEAKLDWGPDYDLSGEGGGMFPGMGRMVDGTWVTDGPNNGPYGPIDWTDTRDRCQKEGGYCETTWNKNDYCRGTRVLYQTQCENECVCCKPETEIDYGHEGHKLVLHRRKKTWKCARDICRDNGGDLYVPPSVEALIRFLRDKHLYKQKVWVGINDFQKARKYEGVHGNCVTGGWMRDQPRRKDPGEDCVAVEDFSRKFKGLRVRPCVEEYFFVCDIGENHNSEHDVNAF